MMPDRIYLAVPYAEKDQAKSLGARWDIEAKKWWVRSGTDLSGFSKWFPKDLGEQMETPPEAWEEEDEETQHDWARQAHEESISAYLFVAPMTCWKCKKAVHFFFLRAGNGMVTGESQGLFRKGVLSQLLAFQKRNPGRFNLGLIKKRFSKTVGASYLSQGCPFCDALFGDFPLSEAAFFYFAEPRSDQQHLGFRLDLDQVLEDGGVVGNESWIGAEACPIPLDPSVGA